MTTISFLGYCPRKNENTYTKIHTPLLIAVLFITARNQKQPDYPSAGQEINCVRPNYGIRPNNKETNWWHTQQHDESLKYCATWEWPNTKGHRTLLIRDIRKGRFQWYAISGCQGWRKRTDCIREWGYFWGDRHVCCHTCSACYTTSWRQQTHQSVHVKLVNFIVLEIITQ